MGAEARNSHRRGGFPERRGAGGRTVSGHHSTTAGEKLPQRLAGPFRLGVEVREPSVQTPQRVAREVQPTQRVEAQPAAEARLRRSPDCDRKVRRTSQTGDESRIGEGDLEDDDQIRPGRQNLLQCRVGGGGVQQQTARPGDLPAAGVLQRRHHGLQPLLGKGHVEGGAAERKYSKFHPGFSRRRAGVTVGARGRVAPQRNPTSPRTSGDVPSRTALRRFGSKGCTAASRMPRWAGEAPSPRACVRRSDQACAISEQPLDRSPVRTGPTAAESGAF